MAFALVVACGAVPVLPAGPAAAQGGALTLGLQVSGTLPTFPCGSTCRTTFSGTMAPSGVAEVTTGTIRVPGVTDVPDPRHGYVATFALEQAAVTGWADYNEPGTPLCPGKGTAAGRVEISAPAVGVLTSAENATAVAEVESVYVSSSFSYDRVGSSAAIVARGWLRVSFRMLSGGATGYFDLLLYGAGSGVFKVDPLQTTAACLSGGPVGYQVVADVAILTSTPYTL